MILYDPKTHTRPTPYIFLTSTLQRETKHKRHDLLHCGIKYTYHNNELWVDCIVWTREYQTTTRCPQYVIANLPNVPCNQCDYKPRAFWHSSNLVIRIVHTCRCYKSLTVPTIRHIFPTISKHHHTIAHHIKYNFIYCRHLGEKINWQETIYLNILCK